MASAADEGAGGGGVCYCTYALTRESMVNQSIFVCNTCTRKKTKKDGKGKQKRAPPPQECCCVGCSKTCHAGHDVIFLAVGRGYCDCGASSCLLMQQSEVVASKALCFSNEGVLPSSSSATSSSSASSATSSNDNSNLTGEVFYIPSLAATATATDAAAAAASQGGLGDALRLDCQTLAALSKETFWIGADQAPRCAMEAFAKSVFDYHCTRLSLPVVTRDDGASTSGAEFWVQVKNVISTASSSLPSSSSSSSESEIENDSSSSSSSNGGGGGGDGGAGGAGGGAVVGGVVDLHYDKDEVVAAQFELGLFPTLSTVTYLSSTSSSTPTLVFLARARDPIGTPIGECLVSYTHQGKHLCFDGELLHGAPSLLPFVDAGADAAAAAAREEGEGESEVARGGCGGGGGGSQKEGGGGHQGVGKIGIRVTFLVNIWTSHHPAGVESLPADIVAQLSLPPTAAEEEEEEETGAGAMFVFEQARAEELAATSSSSSSSSPSPLMTTKDLLISESSCEVEGYGTWADLPFISEKATWGKGFDEQELCLSLFLPKEALVDSGEGKSFRVIFEDDDCAARLFHTGNGEDEGEEEEEVWEEEEGEEGEGEEEEAEEEEKEGKKV